MTTETNEGSLKAIEHACEIIELADARLLAGDGPAGNQPPDMSLAEWRELYVTLDAARKQPPAPVGDAPTEDGFDHSAKVERETEARNRCPEHGVLCAGEMCCCKDLHTDATALHTDPSYSTKAGESLIALVVEEEMPESVKSGIIVARNNVETYGANALTVYREIVWLDDALFQARHAAKVYKMRHDALLDQGLAERKRVTSTVQEPVLKETWRFRSALAKIALLRFADNVHEPLDEALDIADAALFPSSGRQG